MVKVRKFKKKLGKRSRGFRLRRMTRLKMRRGKLARRKGIRMKRGKRKLKKFSYKKKSFKKQFSKYKRGVVGQARSKKNPRKLHKLKQSVKTLLGSFTEIVCDYFVNTKLAYVDEIPRTTLQRQLASRARVVNDLSVSNPGALFKGDNSVYGIESSTVNPPVMFEKTVVSFEGHSDMSPMFSLFSPLNCSYKAINALSAILGLTVSECTALVDIILDTTIGYQATYDMNNPNTQITFYSAPLSHLARTDTVHFTAEVTGNTIRAFQKNIFAGFLEGTGMKNIPRFVNNNALLMLNRINTDGTTDTVVSVVPFEISTDVDAHSMAVRVLGRAAVTQFNPGVVLFNVNASTEIPIGNARMLTNNGFVNSLSCISLVKVETQRLFINFLTDVLVFTENKYGFNIRSQVINNVVVMRPDPLVNTDSCFGIYFLELLNKESLSLSSFMNLNELQKTSYVKLKLVSKKTLVYSPKYESNAHFLFLPKGVTASVKTEYHRDYSGFMNLFSVIEKNDILKSKLTDYGKQFYRKLEPAYNLSVI